MNSSTAQAPLFFGRFVQEISTERLRESIRILPALKRAHSEGPLPPLA